MWGSGWRKDFASAGVTIYTVLPHTVFFLISISLLPYCRSTSFENGLANLQKYPHVPRLQLLEIQLLDKH